jgi:uracil phosphoribosyltransferase
VTRDLELLEETVKTPVGVANVKILKSSVFCLVPILRAGLGMTESLTSLLGENTSVGHIGLYRDHETLLPHTYYVNLPRDVSEATVILLDPMLATGSSAIAALDLLTERKVKKIKFMCLIASRDGVKALNEAYPDVDIYAAGLDDTLNEHGYIIPGLGDAGDRLFGTI